MRTEPITLTEEELGDALTEHSRNQYSDELYDGRTGEVTYQDHTCHAFCAADVIVRVLATRERRAFP